MTREPLISVVEDDPSLREAIIELVESAGYRARGFASAEAFLNAGDTASDCIVTDIQMPGLDGIGLKRRLDELQARVPVIMVTARTEQALHMKAQQSGVAALLLKPFSGEAFLSCLRRVLAG